MCLTRWTTEKDPRQGSPVSAWMGGAKEKDWPKRPSDHQLQETRKKDSDRAIAAVAEAVYVPKHLVLPGSPQAKQLCHSHWGRAAPGKKKSCVYACRVALVASDSLPPCRLWPARLLCQSGVLQARILEHIGQYWLPYPSRTLYFLPP